MPAEFPKKGPLLVTELSTLFNRSFGGALAGDLRNPSTIPYVPPNVKAVRYVTPVPYVRSSDQPREGRAERDPGRSDRADSSRER